MECANKSAGILPLFNGEKQVLLGLEYRKRYDDYYWMEFGGKNEEGESLAETAFRETCEETAYSLGITLERVLKAEERQEFIDFLNPDTEMFFRMYLIYVDQIIPIETIRENGKKYPDHLEKVDWCYFNYRDVIYSDDGKLPGTDYKIYSTSMKRFKLIRHENQ
jgi:8-oxo-dGTP pyrophosphatase MutT (NUDIX family)